MFRLSGHKDEVIIDIGQIKKDIIKHIFKKFLIYLQLLLLFNSFIFEFNINDMDLTKIIKNYLIKLLNFFS